MYDVSTAFVEATKQKTRVSRIRGTITTKSGNVINISDANLVKGSLSIDNKCVNGSNFEYGAVYQGQACFSLLETVDRYTLYDAEVELEYLLQVAGGTFETVPLGVFYIAEPNRTKNILAIKSYDGMQKLDVNVGEQTTGSVWDLLSHIADKCGVELAQTGEEINALTNADIKYVYAIDPDRVGTYRDAVAYLAMVTCSFATMDRAGRLKLVQFGTESVNTFTESERSASTISDFETYFSGVTARFLAEENFAPYEAYVEEGSGLTLDMGDIPIVQGLPELKHEIMNNILAALSTVRYTPCNINVAGGNPALDLGDVITNTHNGVETVSLVTRFAWNYRNGQTLESAGANPRLGNAKSKTDKLFSNSETTLNNRDVVVHSFVNTSNLSISDREKDIIKMTYASNIEGCKPILIATVQLAMDLDGYVVFRFYLDAVIQEDFTYRKYLERGEHFVTFMFHSVLGKSGRAKLVITGQTEFFESDHRIDHANLLTNNNAITAIADFINTPHADNVENVEDVVDNVSWEVVPVDITVPTCYIAKKRANALLFGQGLAAAVPWDGTFEFVEMIPAIDIPGIAVRAITDGNDYEPINPETTINVEILAKLDIPGIAVRAITGAHGMEVVE